MGPVDARKNWLSKRGFHTPYSSDGDIAVAEGRPITLFNQHHRHLNG